MSGGALPSRGRRLFLARFGAGVPASVALACAPAPRADRRVRLALASLREAARAEVVYAGEPTEVVRTATGVTARSLLCSHFGCRVEWRSQERRYRCLCHEGLFDAEGRPVAGPPNRPLRRVRAEVVGAEVLIGER